MVAVSSSRRLLLAVVGVGGILFFGLALLRSELFSQSRRPPAPAPLSPQEEKVRKAMADDLTAFSPTHRLRLKNSRAVEGIIVEETNTTITLKQSFGPQNYLSVPYSKSEILSVEALPVLVITAEDVKLKMEFPGLKFFKRPPYSVVTDESYFLVRNAMDALEDLYRQFYSTFADWVGPAQSPLAVHIVFFGDQEAFRRYAAKEMPLMESASGFYSIEKSRLVLFNQTASEDLKELQGKIANLRRKWLATPGGIPPAIEAELRLLESRGLEYTYMVIRHEAAHQLFHSYGVLKSRFRISWLEEGMAAYCETPTIGKPNPYRIQDLKALVAENKTIPWRDLVQFQSARGFVAGEPTWVKAAYSQSWLLVYSLMSSHRENFFNVLRQWPNDQDFNARSPEPVSSRLAQSLGVPWPTLEQEWDFLLKQLTEN
ncbi:MAG: DUF1570 domain-containing protein [Acidobacteria bacterium]|nr:DUF1570 domain-containing protein [Acidobacteriota bacterium]MBI3657822.1 DUF1570 domain-containing protein [Acidobacteriota bacterium]